MKENDLSVTENVPVCCQKEARMALSLCLLSNGNTRLDHPGTFPKDWATLFDCQETN